MNKIYKKAEIKDLGNSKKQILAELDASLLKDLEDKILEDKAKNIVVPGFRKGEAPKELVLKYFSQEDIKNEAAKELAAQALAQIIVENQIKAIGTPHINIDSLGESEFKISAELSVLPEIERMPDYKEIARKHNAKEEEKVEVSEEDLENVILYLRREKARILTLEAMQKDKNIQMPDINALPEDKLPQLDEKDYKDLAGADNFEDFKTNVKKNILMEKELAAKEKRRAELAEELIENTTVNIPEDLVDMEIMRTKEQFINDLAMMGMPTEAYLAQIGKSMKDLEKEWREPARKRAVLQILMDKIAELENIKADTQEVEKELAHILQHHPQANRGDVQAFVEAQLSNQKVFEFLESIK